MNVESKEPQQIQMSLIRVVPGHNPRTYFNPAALAELADLIKARGIVTPMLVRAAEDGGYDLIAGERRLRAARMVLDEHAMVPVRVFVCAAAEMKAIAIIENGGRVEMGPANEAEGAHQMMVLLKGDKAEVAAHLGWKPDKLERRLALLRATTEVRQALSEEKISLGHAELLAAVPPEKQNSALASIITRKLPIAVLRKELDRISNVLKEAVFDKAECATCQFSSEQQGAMFAESLEAGRCTNPTCWDAKTERHIEGLVATLREEVPRVEVVRPTSVVEPIRLVPAGASGVGVEQAKACRACSNYGYVVSALPGSTGQVERSMCFDADCHEAKVSAHLTRQAKAATAAQCEAENQGSDAATRIAGGAKPSESGGAIAEPQKSKVEAKSPQALSVSIGTRLKEYRVAVWRQAAARKAFSTPELSRDLLLALALTGNTRHIDKAKMVESMGKLGGKTSGFGLYLTDLQEAINGLSDKTKATLVQAMAASAMASVDERVLVDSMRFLTVDLLDYWSFCAEYLTLLTKSEIYAVCVEVGLVERMGTAKFKEVMSGKKEQFIKAVMTVSGFDYRVLPRSMSWAESVPAEGGGDDVEVTTENSVDVQRGSGDDDEEEGDRVTTGAAAEQQA